MHNSDDEWHRQFFKTPEWWQRYKALGRAAKLNDGVVPTALLDEHEAWLRTVSRTRSSDG